MLPAALVQDEQGALLLLDLLPDRAHELVVDPGVVDPAAQAAEDAAGRAHRDGTGRSGDDRPDDDAEGADAGTALERAPVGRLVDADPAEPAPVDDRRIDDLHVVVGLVDALDGLQEASRGVTVVDGERRQGLVGLPVVAHGCSSPLVRLPGRCAWRSPDPEIATGDEGNGGRCGDSPSRGRVARRPSSTAASHPGRPLTDRSRTSRLHGGAGHPYCRSSLAPRLSLRRNPDRTRTGCGDTPILGEPAGQNEADAGVPASACVSGVAAPLSSTRRPGSGC